jgi:hypothetical protein
MDFGVLGVIIELTAFGALCGWLYARSRQGPVQTKLVYAYAATLFALSIHTGLLDSVLALALPAVTLLTYSVVGARFRSAQGQ